MTYSIAIGEVVDVLRDFNDNSFDAVTCDPPYGFSFMNKKWDYDVPSVDLWRECLRVLKPGAPLVAFGGSRTYHRLACGIEDAGFEMRDCLMWLYGKGFPKGQRIDNEIWKRARRCLSSDSVKRVEQCSPARRLIVNGSALVAARIQPEGAPALIIQTGMEGGSCALTAMLLSQSEAENIASSTILLWSETSDADYEKARTFTTRTESEATIDSKTWSLLTGLLTFTSTTRVQNSLTLGAPAHALLVERSSNDGGLRCAHIPALTALGSVIENLCEAWRGGNVALKPAHEPIVLARKPLDGTMAQNVARWGMGGLAIDACRIDASGRPLGQSGTGTASGMFAGNGSLAIGTTDGRWPANLLLDEEAAALLDAEAGDRPSAPYREHTAGGAVLPLTKRTAGGYADGGGPSRFFYCSKVSTKEREAGCEGLPLRSAGEVTEREDGSDGLESPRAGAGRTGGARNHHPTLKPISLTTWLARLILPPAPGVLLVPFAGAGSEMIGALKAGWPYVFGIEREEEYAQIARSRLAYWCKESEAA